MRHTFAVLLGFALVAAPMDAQQRPRSDSLPRELVVALLGGSLGNRRVDVQAGFADDSLPAELFRDALILGVADYGFSRTTVAYFPYAPQASEDTIRARLASAGWTAPQQRADTIRGFVSSYSGSFPQVICKEGSVIIPTTTIRTINRTLATINRQRREGSSLCDRDPMRMMSRMNPVQDTPLPPLPAPAGMQSRGSGTGGAPDQEGGMTMQASLMGAASAPAILAHYERAFTASGWRKVEEASSKSIGAATFEITARGASWYCALVVSTPASDETQVQLILRKR
jgi:hypothetical protein